jgi:putative transposase
MRMNALRARPRPRQFPKDQGERSIIAPNVLEREFDATAPNQKLGAEFTYIGTAEGWLYVAVVIDRFSRRGVGWSPLGSMLGMRLPGQWMKETMIAQMVTDALMMAIWRRGWSKELIHHSDQGRQYTSEPFQRLVTNHGVTCSMSRSGNVWEFKLLHASGSNDPGDRLKTQYAKTESFFASLKIERVKRKFYRTRDQARADVFDYIERFYNPTRRHSTIGYLSPMQYEERAMKA